MAQQKRGLGRGLGALIPTGPVPGGPGPSAGGAPDRAMSRWARVPVNRSRRLVPLPGPTSRRCRSGRLPPTCASPARYSMRKPSMSWSIRSARSGSPQPVVVREVKPGRFELIMGERRWRASQRAGLTEIPAIVRATADDDLLRDALMENLHREQLNPLEEAAAYQQLLDDFGATHEELARKVGRSRPHISNTLRLLNLFGPVHRRVAAGVLSAGHARALLALADADAQDHLAHRIVAEGLSVRAVEEIVTMGDVRPAKTRRPVTRQASGPRWTGWPTGCQMRSTPGSRWNWACARGRSWWSSARSRTWSGSSPPCRPSGPRH